MSTEGEQTHIWPASVIPCLGMGTQQKCTHMCPQNKYKNAYDSISWNGPKLQQQTATKQKQTPDVHW